MIPLTANVISCSKKEDEDITVELERTLKDQIFDFNGETILDYSKSKEEIEKDYYNDGFNASLSILSFESFIKRKLIEKIPDLYKRYPYFTFSLSDPTGIKEENTLNKSMVSGSGHFPLLFEYNLHQLNDFDKEKFIQNHSGIGVDESNYGRYILKETTGNEISFDSGIRFNINYISNKNNTDKLNMIVNQLNNTPPIYI